MGLFTPPPKSDPPKSDYSHEQRISPTITNAGNLMASLQDLGSAVVSASQLQDALDDNKPKQ